MPFTKQPNVEPIPGYRLLAPLGSGGFGEVWKCAAPGGLFKAIKFVYGNRNAIESNSTQAHEELRAIQRIKGLRHPFLLSIDRVEWVNGELMLVTELADENLHEVLVEYQHKGLPGIPRAVLLHYLKEAAEVLDVMNVQLGLLHLDIKPRNLFLVSKHVKVADFGLVTSMTASSAGVKLGAVTPLYAAPEVFQGKVSHASDQYSLAVCYMELLTGKLPFNGRNSRQLLIQHLQAEPELTPLCATDRSVLARALAKDPSQRFPTCLDLLRALEGQAAPAAAGSETRAERWARVSDPAFGHNAASVVGPMDGTLRRGTTTAPGPRHEDMMQTPTRKLGDTDVPRLCKSPLAVPAALAGYQFIENQGSSLLADVWKAAAPDGQLRQVKFIYGLAARDQRGIDEAVRRLKALRHPALMVIEVVQTDPGCLVLVNDMAKETLRDRWQRCQAQKLPGIPRAEMLGYLRTVAEALDYLYEQQAILHLGLNPRNLRFVDGSLQLADFGLAHLFWLPAGQPLAQRNARYAAPELYEHQVHRATDQYSLALLYQELLTGAYAFAGQNRGAAAPRSKIEPDLRSLPADDQAVIARGLEADAKQRWPSCCAMVRALEAVHSDNCGPDLDGNAFSAVIATPPPVALPQVSSSDREALIQILNDLVGQAVDERPADDIGSQPVLSESGAFLTHKFRAGLPLGAARVKLDAFRQQANGLLLRDEGESYDFHLTTPTNFWQQWMGRQPGLDVRVQLTKPHALSATPIDVTATVKAVRCGQKKAAQLVGDIGANLLDGLRAFLLVNSEKRTQDRLLWPHLVQVCSVDSDGTMGPAIVCRGKDISLSGIGFYLPQELATSHVLISMSTSPHTPPITIPATLVRAQRCADGWYDVGALFRLAVLRKTLPEICLL
jgi:serine/threonine protein kinase